MKMNYSFAKHTTRENIENSEVVMDERCAATQACYDSRMLVTSSAATAVSSASNDKMKIMIEATIGKCHHCY